MKTTYLSPLAVLVLLNTTIVFSRLPTIEAAQLPNDTQKLTIALTNLEGITRRLETLESLKCEKSQKQIPKNCKEIQDRGNKLSGIYLIEPDFAPKPFLVLCNLETKGGGWTHFMNRYDGSQNFYLNWTDYKQGFGKLTRESWLGLENLYHLTGFEANELLVELEDWEGNSAYALYNAFVLGSEKEGYPIKILGDYSGNAGDSLRYHEGMKFTTLDKDQDRRNWSNCAKDEKGSWWYNMCSWTNLTARYLKGNVTTSDRFRIMYWMAFKGPSYSLKQARMLVRPRSSSLLPPKTK